MEFVGLRYCCCIDGNIVRFVETELSWCFLERKVASTVTIEEMPHCSFCRNGIEVVFIGTKSGLTRYHTLVENITDRSVTLSDTVTICQMAFRHTIP